MYGGPNLLNIRCDGIRHVTGLHQGLLVSLTLELPQGVPVTQFVMPMVSNSSGHALRMSEHQRSLNKPNRCGGSPHRLTNMESTTSCSTKKSGAVKTMQLEWSTVSSQGAPIQRLHYCWAFKHSRGFDCTLALLQAAGQSDQGLCSSTRVGLTPTQLLPPAQQSTEHA
jgi:hypothetical protein